MSRRRIGSPPSDHHEIRYVQRRLVWFLTLLIARLRGRNSSPAVKLGTSHGLGSSRNMRSWFRGIADRRRSKLVAIAICMSMPASESLAISRYDVGNKSCAELHAILRREGAAILRWRSQRTGMILYERFVLNWDFCPAGQITDVSTVPAADGFCPVPKCVELEDFWTW